MMRTCPILFLCFTVLPLAERIAHGARKFEEMDYGRFLAATYNNAEGQTTLQGKGCATNKGIAIKVGPNNEGTILFDTDLCRMAGAWVGGWLKLTGVVFDESHGPNPQPAPGSTMVFQTNPTPGWSSGNSFDDPRTLPTGPGAATAPFGPLPRDWAKYDGLYVNGDLVVLAYHVGTALIRELPGFERSEAGSVLTRTLNVATPGSHQAHMVIADGGDQTSAVVNDGPEFVVMSDGKGDGPRLFIGAVGTPNGSSWELRGNRVILKLPQFAGGEAFKIIYFRGLAGDGPRFQRLLKSSPAPTQLEPLLTGGTSRWPDVVKTTGEPGKADGNDAFVVDSIAPPTNNPYKSWIRFGGLDFFKDGRAALCTWSGDVWIASGIDENLREISWRRYATGLFQALGLKIVDETVYVLGRDQITRLHDLNGDGEADRYENFNNDVQVTPGFHEFALDLHTDPAGNFYFCKSGPVSPGGRGWGPLSDHNGTVLRISKDGQTLDVFATGIRAANGMGVGPHGEVTCGDNQGTWVPACYVHLVRKGDFISVADLAHRAEKPTDYGRHICFLPMDVDNSGGAQVWVTSDKWGPMKDRLLHLSYGRATLLSILPEEVNGQVQGGAVTFPLKFETGIMRARFHPVDGQLYITGLRGWQTRGSKDAAFYRVRFTGKPVQMQSSLRVTDKGIHIGFFNPVEARSAGDPQNYSIQQYNYRWTQDYGSAEYKVSNPQEKGRDEVEVRAVTVAPDGKSVFLDVPGLRTVMQMRIKMNLTAADGTPLPKEITNTINFLGKE